MELKHQESNMHIELSVSGDLPYLLGEMTLHAHALRNKFEILYGGEALFGVLACSWSCIRL